jgi:hypothetical protein
MVDFWTVFGTWLGALCTLAIWSFLYKDNPFYKFAEHVFVGVSAAYGFVLTIYNIMIPNLFDRVINDFSGNWLLLVPGILGLMMLSRLLPRLDWLSKYPLALMIGTTAGLSLLNFLKTDVMNQMVATIINPFKINQNGDSIGQIATESIGIFILIIGTISGLVYFYFSKKHDQFVGGVARTGIVFLMISFGAGFGYTVMARISLLIGRLQFLLGEWLGLLN